MFLCLPVQTGDIFIDCCYYRQRNCFAGRAIESFARRDWLSARLDDLVFAGFVRQLLDATYQIAKTKTNRRKHHDRVVYLLVHADALGGYLICPGIRAAAATI